MKSDCRKIENICILCYYFIGDFMEEKNLKIGCHLSSSNGYLAMAKQILELNGNTFQFFTRNPRGGQAKPLDINDMEEFNKFAEEHDIGYVIAHAPYTLNLCALEESKRQFAIDTFKDDLSRLQHINKAYYNFHPGSHVNQGTEIGIKYITDALNQIITADTKTLVLLETMAGKGSEVGRSFQEIKAIIDGIELKDHIGVCLDTCHVSDAGYDIVNNLDQVLDEFDEIIGLDRLKAIHLNDSMNPCGSHKDRHQKIGQGYLGLDAVTNIINNPRLKDLPFILETPNELPGYKEEIDLLKGKYIR